MRALDSWRKQEAKLRSLHTQQANAGQWLQAQTTRTKLIAVLDKIRELEKAADHHFAKTMIARKD